MRIAWALGRNRLAHRGRVAAIQLLWFCDVWEDAGLKQAF